jgi:putative hydrolase of the HAD superfamily
MARQSTSAVLLDSLGTLVSMEWPAPHLRDELLRRTGMDVGEEAAERAVRAEISYYLEHQLEGSDPAALSDLRDRCADTVRDALGQTLALDHATARGAMLGALHFAAFPDAPATLRALRERGLRLVVASNWDCSLPGVLERVGLAALLDGVVTSAAVGAGKPDPALFSAALEVAGCDAPAAVHVGDSLENDVAGARAAGIEPVLLDRGGAASPDGVVAIASLSELPGLLETPP